MFGRLIFEISLLVLIWGLFPGFRRHWFGGVFPGSRQTIGSCMSWVSFWEDHVETHIHRQIRVCVDTYVWMYIFTCINEEGMERER